MPQPLDYQSPDPPAPDKPLFRWGGLLILASVLTPAFRYANPISLDSRFIILLSALTLYALLTLLWVIFRFIAKRSQPRLLSLIWTGGCALVALTVSYAYFHEWLVELGIL